MIGSVVRKHLKDISKLLVFPRSITFQDFRRGGPHGLLDMVFLGRIYRRRVPGAPRVWTCIQVSPTAPPLSSTPFVPTSLFSYLILLGAWGPLTPTIGMDFSTPPAYPLLFSTFSVWWDCTFYDLI